jgi:hypothetical protein
MTKCNKVRPAHGNKHDENDDDEDDNKRERQE